MWPQTIIQQYPRNVKRVVATLTLPSIGNFSLHILSKGGLRLSCEEGQVEAILSYLKSIHFEPVAETDLDIA